MDISRKVIYRFMYKNEAIVLSKEVNFYMDK